MNRLFLAILAASAVACGTVPSRAATTDDGVINVTTADLDLATQSGRAVLHSRVLKAARHLCVAGNGAKPMDMVQTCVDNVYADTTPQIDQVIAQARPGPATLAFSQ